MNIGPQQMAPGASTGALVLVVGPSGAGKDTLLTGAHGELSAAANFMFPRREITRPQDAGGEDHVAIEMDAFRVRCRAGAYGLFWRAHGMGYGLPRRIDDWLQSGRLVAVNASRSVVAQARDRYARVAIVTVTAPTALLTARLLARGRETADEVARRVARSAMPAPQGPDAFEIVNDGSPNQAIGRFVKLLRQIHLSAAPVSTGHGEQRISSGIGDISPYGSSGRDAGSS